MQNNCLKIVSIIIIHAFLITNIGFAAPQSSPDELDSFYRPGTTRLNRALYTVAAHFAETVTADIDVKSGVPCKIEMVLVDTGVTEPKIYSIGSVEHSAFSSTAPQHPMTARVASETLLAVLWGKEIVSRYDENDVEALERKLLHAIEAHKFAKGVKVLPIALKAVRETAHMAREAGIYEGKLTSIGRTSDVAKMLKLELTGDAYISVIDVSITSQLKEELDLPKGFTINCAVVIDEEDLSEGTFTVARIADIATQQIAEHRQKELEDGLYVENDPMAVDNTGEVLARFAEIHTLFDDEFVDGMTHEEVRDKLAEELSIGPSMSAGMFKAAATILIFNDDPAVQGPAKLTVPRGDFAADPTHFDNLKADLDEKLTQPPYVIAQDPGDRSVVVVATKAVFQQVKTLPRFARFAEEDLDWVGDLEPMEAATIMDFASKLDRNEELILNTEQLRRIALALRSIDPDILGSARTLQRALERNRGTASVEDEHSPAAYLRSLGSLQNDIKGARSDRFAEVTKDKVETALKACDEIEKACKPDAVASNPLEELVPKLKDPLSVVRDAVPRDLFTAAEIEDISEADLKTVQNHQSLSKLTKSVTHYLNVVANSLKVKETLADAEKKVLAYLNKPENQKDENGSYGMDFTGIGSSCGLDKLHDTTFVSPHELYCRIAKKHDQVLLERTTDFDLRFVSNPSPAEITASEELITERLKQFDDDRAQNEAVLAEALAELLADPDLEIVPEDLRRKARVREKEMKAWVERHRIRVRFTKDESIVLKGPAHFAEAVDVKGLKIGRATYDLNVRTSKAGEITSVRADVNGDIAFATSANSLLDVANLILQDAPNRTTIGKKTAINEDQIDSMLHGVAREINDQLTINATDIWGAMGETYPRGQEIPGKFVLGVIDPDSAGKRAVDVYIPGWTEDYLVTARTPVAVFRRDGGDRIRIPMGPELRVELEKHLAKAAARADAGKPTLPVTFETDTIEGFKSIARGRGRKLRSVVMVNYPNQQGFSVTRGDDLTKAKIVERVDNDTLRQMEKAEIERVVMGSPNTWGDLLANEDDMAVLTFGLGKVVERLQEKANEVTDPRRIGCLSGKLCAHVIGFQGGKIKGLKITTRDEFIEHKGSDVDFVYAALSPDVIPELIEAAKEDPVWNVRYSAVDALGKFDFTKYPEVKKALDTIAVTDENDSVRLRATHILEEGGAFARFAEGNAAELTRRGFLGASAAVATGAATRLVDPVGLLAADSPRTRWDEMRSAFQRITALPENRGRVSVYLAAGLGAKARQQLIASLTKQNLEALAAVGVNELILPADVIFAVKTLNFERLQDFLVEAYNSGITSVKFAVDARLHDDGSFGIDVNLRELPRETVKDQFSDWQEIMIRLCSRLSWYGIYLSGALPGSLVRKMSQEDLTPGVVVNMQPANREDLTTYVAMHGRLAFIAKTHEVSYERCEPSAYSSRTGNNYRPAAPDGGMTYVLSDSIYPRAMLHSSRNLHQSSHGHLFGFRMNVRPPAGFSGIEQELPSTVDRLVDTALTDRPQTSNGVFIRVDTLDEFTRFLNGLRDMPARFAEDKTEVDVPGLTTRLDEANQPDATERYQAADSLGRHADASKDAIPALIAAANNDSVWSVRWAAVDALGQFDFTEHPEAKEALEAIAAQESKDVNQSSVIQRAEYCLADRFAETTSTLETVRAFLSKLTGKSVEEIENNMTLGQLGLDETKAGAVVREFGALPYSARDTVAGLAQRIDRKASSGRFAEKAKNDEVAARVKGAISDLTGVPVDEIIDDVQLRDLPLTDADKTILTRELGVSLRAVYKVGYLIGQVRKAGSGRFAETTAIAVAEKPADAERIVISSRGIGRAPGFVHRSSDKTRVPVRPDESPIRAELIKAGLWYNAASNESTYNTAAMDLTGRGKALFDLAFAMPPEAFVGYIVDDISSEQAQALKAQGKTVYSTRGGDRSISIILAQIEIRLEGKMRQYYENETIVPHFSLYTLRQPVEVDVQNLIVHSLMTTQGALGITKIIDMLGSIGAQANNPIALQEGLRLLAEFV